MHKYEGRGILLILSPYQIVFDLTRGLFYAYGLSETNACMNYDSDSE